MNALCDLAKNPIFATVSICTVSTLWQNYWRIARCWIHTLELLQTTNQSQAITEFSIFGNTGGSYVQPIGSCM